MNDLAHIHQKIADMRAETEVWVARNRQRQMARLNPAESAGWQHPSVSAAALKLEPAELTDQPPLWAEVQALLSEADLRALHAQAQAQDLSIAQLMVSIIQRYLAQQPPAV